jgi:hypothetical protein
MRPDFSKEGLKRFFLYHTEKIILGVSILLMGLFFWLGFSAPPFKDKSPTDLIGMADRAEQYVAKTDSWEQIRELDARKGETDLVKRIQVGNEAIQVSNYPFGFWSIRAKTLSTRKDPQLIPAKDLVAKHFVAPLFFTPTNLRKDAAVEDPLSEIPLVSEALASDSPPPRRGPGRGQPGDDTEGRRGDQRGGMPDAGDASSSTRPEDEKTDIEVGDRILAIHKQTLPGIRPAKWELSNQTESVLLDDVVVVTGLVNVKELKRNFNESFSDAVGYLPSRDKPAFKYLEVQRAEVGEAEPQWVDISEQISRLISATPKSLTVMPNSEFPSAPEVVDPSCFDPVITQPIPAFTQFDYRKIANHPTLNFRTPEALKGETKAAVVTDIFANDDVPDSEGDAELAEEKIPIRLGSDTAKYAEAMTDRKLKNDYKLVRFFDLSRKETGKQYQYRVRYWVSDPNNFQAGGGQMAGALGERGESASRGGGRAPGGRPPGGSKNMATGGAGGNMSAGDGLGAGKGGGAQEGEARGGGPGRGGPGRGDAARGGAGQGRTGSGQEADEDAGYAAVEITPQMKDPEVRARLTKAEEKQDEKDKSKVVYYVQEPGYEELVQVPKGRDDLRFCRPSAWSEPIKVVINPQPRGDVIAGNVEKPRTIRVGSFELLDGEPLIDLVVAPWDRALRAMLPGRKKAYRGEALDFVASAHVLNPLSWLVHKLDNAPIFSQTVMVDLMGGSELALPKDDVMRYHTAAEMLIMEPDGSLKVTNDLADRTKYKQALLLPDDPKEFGTPREKKQEEDDNRGSEFGGRGR